ncbi:MAG: tetratricopeptide repeat protein [Gallionellaceae bacterium]|nr:tetratricopeptide repeat protein [Gallionellaceae bacterium]
MNYFRQRDRAWLLSLFAMVCLVYLPFLGNPFIFDDLPFFTSDAPEHYAHAPFQFDLRWLPYASLGWTYAIFSDVNTYFFHLGNMLLHIGNAILLFYLLRQLVGAVISERDESAAVTWGTWFGALLFACHPVVVYAVGYIVQRSILLATFFALAMQLAYLRGLLTGQKRWLALAVLAYFLACFSKEHSVLLPAVLAALTILLYDKNQASRTVLWATWGAFAAIGLLVVLRVKGVFGSPYEVGATALFEQQGIVESTPMLHLLSVLTQAGLFFKYLLLWALPNPAWISVDMREPIVASIGEWRGWLGATVFLAYGLMAFRLLLRRGATGLVGFALLYPWLQFWLEFSSIRVQEIFVLYRSYLWLPGMALLIPLLLAKWPGKKTLLVLGLATLLLLPLAWNRLWVFADEYRLWDDAAKLLRSGEAPLASRIFYNRAHAEANLGKWEAAVIDYEKAIARHFKVEPIMLHDLGVAYFNTGRYQDALVQFDKTIALDPKYAKAYFDKGMTLKKLHQDDLAMQQMVKSCELKYVMACVIVKMAPPKK